MRSFRGKAAECQSASAAIRRAEALSRIAENVGAVAFSRAGDPAIGDFTDAVVLKAFGDVPDLSNGNHLSSAAAAALGGSVVLISSADLTSPFC